MYDPYPNRRERPWALETELEARGFFYEHAGYSIAPGETATQGHARTATELARAELEYQHRGWSYVTEYDPDVMDDDADSRELVESGEAVNLVVLLLHDECPPNPHNIVSTLGGVVVPSDDDPYVRVVAAELALEVLA